LLRDIAHCSSFHVPRPKRAARETEVFVSFTESAVDSKYGFHFVSFCTKLISHCLPCNILLFLAGRYIIIMQQSGQMGSSQPFGALPSSHYA